MTSIYFIGTMSAGKSTLINSLLSREIMPSGNLACTSKKIKYINKNINNYLVELIYNSGDVISVREEIEGKEIARLINRYNKDENVEEIIVYGRIPFVRICDDMEFIDLPGPNNSNDLSHKKILTDGIESIESGTIIYVMDGTCISSNDSNNILKKILEKENNENIKIIFVINKIDFFEDRMEMEEVVLEAKKLINLHAKHDKYEIHAVSSLAYLVFSRCNEKKLSMDEEFLINNGYFRELSYINKFNNYVSINDITRFESFPFSKTGIVDLKNSIKNK